MTIDELIERLEEYRDGSVLGLASRFALTTSGKLGLEAVQAAINASK